MKWGIVVLAAAILLIPASATTISFKEQYQDYLGVQHPYTSGNVAAYPFYIITDNGNNYTVTRLEDTIELPKANTTYSFQPTKISFTLNLTPAKLNTRSIADGANWYIPIPKPLTALRFGWDDVKPTVINNTGYEISQDNFWYSKVNGQVRFYYNQTARTAGANSQYLLFTFNSYTVDNATTVGWTTNNVSLNGSVWTDDGSLRLALNSSYYSGLVGCWNGDEAAGTIWHNCNNANGSDNATNRGTWNGNTTLNYTTGQIGNAGQFDGVNDYVNVGNNNVLRLNNTMTLSAWIYLQSIGTAQGIISLHSSATGTMYFAVSQFAGPNRIAALLPTIGEIADTGNNVVTVGKWYHVVYTRNGSGATHSIYINGIKQILQNNNTNDYIDTTGNTIFGFRSVGVSPFNGSIDEVRIWNRALGADEIAELYNRSMRTTAMPEIYNQIAGAGNVINRTRIVYTGQDSISNASIYARQNGTTSWILIQANAASNTWYPIIDQFNAMDFGVELNGNGSNTPFFTSLEWDETQAYTPTITSWSNNYTNSGAIAMTIPRNTTVNFNVTSDIVSDNWYWNIPILDGNGTITSNASINFTSMGSYVVTVHGTNAIGNSNTITWSITVSGSCCYNVTGYVNNAIELYLQNARVDLNSTHNYTDSNGYFTISNISEGNYTVLIRAIGYRNSTSTKHINTDTVMNFTLSERTYATVNTPGFEGTFMIGALMLYVAMRRR